MIKLDRPYLRGTRLGLYPFREVVKYRLDQVNMKKKFGGCPDTPHDLV